MPAIRESVIFTGGWEDFTAWTHWIASGAYIPNAQEHLRTTGEEVRKLIRGHIMFQDMGWEPLSPFTIRQKGHGVVFVETQAYVRRLRVSVTKRTYGASVNIAPGKYVHTRSGKAAAEIAFVNEYGDSKIPARPLWRPVYMEMQSLPEIANVPLGEILEIGRWARH